MGYYSGMEVWKRDGLVQVRGLNYQYAFSVTDGLPVSFCYEEQELLQGQSGFEIFRAPIDNDRNVIHDWRDYGVDRVQTDLRRMEIFDERPERLTFHTEHVLAAPSMLPIAWVDSDWTIRKDGMIALSQKVRVRQESEKEIARHNGRTFFLPRFGVRLGLPDSFDRISYFGCGPDESYRDKHHASYKSRFDARVRDMFENYLKPQENGAHMNTQWLRVTNAAGMGLEIIGDDFSFNASPYTPHEIADSAHPYELPESRTTWLILDYAQSGCGSNSCGPQLLPQYRLSEKEFSFSLQIRPIQ